MTADKPAAPVTRPDLDAILTELEEVVMWGDDPGGKELARRAMAALAAETARADQNADGWRVAFNAGVSNQELAEESQRAYEDAVKVANAEKARRIGAEQRIERVRQYAEDRSIHHRGRKNSVVSSWRIASDLIDIVGEASAALTTEQPVDEWCREEGCEFRHWRSGDMPTHKRGERCPAPPADR